MRELLLVGSGGFIGSVARYLVSGAVTQFTATARFPFGTLAVNVLGCFIIGVLAGIAEQSGTFSANTRLLLFTGVLGGFTTFSSFSADVAALWERGTYAESAIYVLASVVMSIAALLLGLYLVRRFA